jgi:two-component system response regulator (stage 0 sporulation protein A)
LKNKIRIVIADDNFDFIDILREFLSHRDEFEIVGTSSNGVDALEVIAAAQPDVVILDIIMPKLDGLGVLEKVRSMGLEKAPQFIIVSAIGNYKTTKIALELGAEFFMVKPFELSDLVSRIRQLQGFAPAREPDRPAPAPPAAGESLRRSIEHQITGILDDIGVPAHLKGYQYIRYAVSMVVQDLTAINAVTKSIYTKIAHEYGSTQSRVERAIRNAIELTWTRGKIEKLDALFKDEFNEEKSRPSNSEFIIMVANKIRDVTLAVK